MRTNIKSIVAIFCFFFVNLLCYSQNYSDYSPKRLKALGDNALEIGDIYSARDFYKMYCDKKKDADVMFQLAECYRASREYVQAATYYDKAYKQDKKNLLALYHYGEMLKIYGYYADAKKCFTQFKQSYKGGYDIDYKRLAANQIASCDSAQYLIDSSAAAEIKRLNSTINKFSVEFAPIFLNDTTLLYSSMRTDTALFVITDEQNPDIPHRQFYVGKKRKGDWQFVGEWLDGDFNQENMHCGNGAFSPDRKQFYFTRCEQNWKYKTLCKIYVSTNERGQWTPASLLPENINFKKTTNTQPTVGIDSKTGNQVLYFSSDRPEGRGGMDIWYSVYDSKSHKWGDPKNCGNRINTTADEVTPFYQNQDKTLYFSSNGMGGLGELDVYRAIGELAKWTSIENVGGPINSGFDDMYYSINSTNTEGFFASNRQSDKNASTCCDDIFSFKYVDKLAIGVEGKVYLKPNEIITKALKDEVEQMAETKIDTTADYVEGVVVSLFMLDENKEKMFISVDTTDEKGQYFFDLQENKDYVLQYESSKYTPPQRTISTQGMTFSDTLYLEDVGVDYIPHDIFVIKNIYYEFDKSNLTMEAKRTISRTLLVIMKEYPQIVVEIGSHTDSKGNDNYNLKLSQRRAESVVNFLIANGIQKERLRAKGYGETKPIAPNENEDGSDNPEGRAKNRRTEFRVIGTLNQYFEIIYEE